MKQLNFNKGRLGEEIAKEYLEKKGYVLVEANHRNYLGEIDLVMIKNVTRHPDKNQDLEQTRTQILDQVQNDANIVFVEVKLKIGDDFGTPEEMLSKGKLERVKRVAEAFLVMNKNQFGDYIPRIEAVCIVLNQNKTINRISHYDQF